MSENGGSIREMAERDAAAQTEPDTLFPGGQFAGDELSIRDLIRPEHKVDATVSFRAAEFASPGESGLLRPTREGLALVTYRWEKPELVPKWDPDKPRDENPDIVGWKVRQVLKPVWIEKLHGEAGVIEANFAELLAADATQAGALLERLTERMRAVVSPA